MGDDQLDGLPSELLARAVSADEVRTVRRLEGRSTHGVYEVSLDDGRVIVKLTDQAGWRLEKEAAILRKLGPERDVPVPAVIDQGRVAQTTYLVTEFCEGAVATDALDSGEARPYFRALGQTLARIHANVGFSQAGNPVADGDGIRVEGDGGWVGTLTGLLDAEADILRGTIFESAAGRARMLLEANASMVAEPAAIRLLHSDMNPDNVFVASEPDITCIIDWEYATAGDPGWDLASVEWTWFDDGPFPSRQFAAVLEGYSGIRDLPAGFDERRRVYRALLPVGTMVALAGGSEVTDGEVDAPADRIEGIQAEFDARCAEVSKG